MICACVSNSADDTSRNRAITASGAAQDPRASSPRVSPWLETAIRQARPDHRHLVWIYFRDKGTTAGTLGAASGVTSSRARLRRGIKGTATAKTSIQDIPVQQSYVERIRAGVVRVRHQSRWMNAVRAEATASQIEGLATLPFIDRLDVLRRYRRGTDERIDPEERPEPIDARSQARPRALARRNEPLDYGSAYDQVAQIGVPELHARGLSGRDVMVAVFDSGFPIDGRIKPDIAALGVRAKVAHPRSTSSYARASGTSFSCPLTAGVVALLLQAHPTYTVDQVLHALRSTASQAKRRTICSDGGASTPSGPWMPASWKGRVLLRPGRNGQSSLFVGKGHNGQRLPSGGVS